MKKLGLYSTLFVLGLLLAACGSNTNPVAKPANTPATPDFAQFLTLVNQFRSQPQTCATAAGTENMPAVGPVAYNDAINTATRLHSEYMATTGNFDHRGQNGSSFSQRNTAAGYTGASRVENIAAGADNVADTLEQWRTSDTGHCQNLMNADINEIGLGYGFNANDQFRHYWTFVSGRRN